MVDPMLPPPLSLLSPDALLPVPSPPLADEELELPVPLGPTLLPDELPSPSPPALVPAEPPSPLPLLDPSPPLEVSLPIEPLPEDDPPPPGLSPLEPVGLDACAVLVACVGSAAIDVGTAAADQRGEQRSEDGNGGDWNGEVDERWVAFLQCPCLRIVYSPGLASARVHGAVMS
ncbi:uncharacterized protein C8Q71DRAFT_327882 [Rhodofomes roseus]|uniref:Uncharacterized protein n=1 Tax=Rhodofomes roseus TaxID=34475 RepID=A0ABQ8KRH8_9APHY|nr:uncharacterized protein C8Q71DRAFT_327882 [Rhodofomes roseus]KAH9841400.1 hypothetical protein C8Q71DRAFT_327882 [Rhodofomes roseus]